GGFDGAQILIEQEYFRIVRCEKQRFPQRGRAEDHHHVAGLDALGPRCDRMAAIESPVRRLALRFSQCPMLLAPAREGRQAQAPRDDAIDMLQQEHLSEQVLVLRAGLQLTHRFVADLQQLRPRYGGQHGWTCTVTSSSSRSFLSRSSTLSAIAWASATLAAESTAMVTSAYRTPAFPPRDRMPYASFTPSTACADKVEERLKKDL